MSVETEALQEEINALTLRIEKLESIVRALLTQENRVYNNAAYDQKLLELVKLNLQKY